MPSHSLSSPSSQTTTYLLFFVLGAVGALTPLAIDMYLPAMPSLARDLGVAEGSVQITLTVYTAGFAIGQFIQGPLADSYGRRPVLIIGVALFAVASVMSALAEGIDALILIRGIQGFAGAAAAVIIQAIVRDMFDREDFSRAMSFITLVITIAPLIAPLLGGYIAIWFGWRGIFWVLAVFPLIVIALVLWKIPETLKEENRQPLHLVSILKHYASLCRNPVVVGLIFSGAFSFAGMFSFLTAGSFVYINIYHVEPNEFGYLFALNIIAMIIMTMINGRFVKKIGSHAMLKLALSIQLFAGVGLFVGWILDLGLWGTVPFVVLFVGTTATIGSNTMALLLSGYPTMAGTVSSLAGTLRFGTGSLMGGTIAFMPDGVVWPMISVMTTCSILSTTCYWIFGRKA
ncbi:Bcr/CflA family multidrug efflux MFS transporter [Vibrio sp. OCN044]|uniref:Bcr/CflA family efflux transporter n=1 Tax=Vibrio tetraodonis subsp. pristinus TaxID=2695891 RepID=A0A6L8LX93_9VIBR|nr:Bcr/CflA family multidrug efflux MFS transporter [Vibrio tetraodonis]MYM60415.1 Bcr/CflA family multidrug efflux MFS transporter [Vibrio tetraodonis subsp. pristinus]